MRSLAVLSVVALAGIWFIAPAAADDAFIVTSFADFTAQQAVHNDLAPFKGWVDLTVTNSGSQPWGDFHFQIYDPMGGQDISNVGFLVDPPYQPTSTQSPLTWAVDNVSIGARIDLFYYSDPVLPGETAHFTVYTDNPDHLSFFGVMLYPTPVPEPASLLLIGCGAILALRRR
jgi:hypothetical protein